MSGLQPGFTLNEKQAGRLRPAPRAVWAGPLGEGRCRGGHTGCAWRPSHQHGRLGGPASRFRPVPAQREGKAPWGRGRTPPWRQMEPVLLLVQPLPHSANLGAMCVTESHVKMFAHFANGSNDMPQGVSWHSVGKRRGYFMDF